MQIFALFSCFRLKFSFIFLRILINCCIFASEKRDKNTSEGFNLLDSGKLHGLRDGDKKRSDMKIYFSISWRSFIIAISIKRK